MANVVTLPEQNPAIRIPVNVITTGEQAINEIIRYAVDNAQAFADPFLRLAKEIGPVSRL